MSTSSWSEAQIHAFVDGELDAPTAARIEADSRADAALAARITAQRELKTLLRGAFDPVLDEPVPQRLREVLAQPTARASVTPIGAAVGAAARKTSPARARWSLREWGAIAATLVLGMLVGALALRSPTRLPLEQAHGRLVARGALDTALSTQPAGAATGTTRINLSFRAADGAWCRGFALGETTTGLACRRQGRWILQLLDGSAPAAGGDYRQAASSLSPAMIDAITALGGGDALSPEDEQQQLRSGWD
jgi:hypothetical protein